MSCEIFGDYALSISSSVTKLHTKPLWEKNQYCGKSPTLMNMKVRGYFTGLAKHLVIMCALMWLFTCLSTEAPDQTTRHVKRLVTLWTVIWLFTCVSTEVLGQIIGLVKRLVTLWTLIWLFTCVSTEVPGQTTILVKRLVILCTLMWLFTCMSTGDFIPVGRLS